MGVVGVLAVLSISSFVYLSENNTAEEWIKKGDAFYKQGKYSEAIECYNKALELNPGLSKDINPKLAEAWNNKGLTFADLGRYYEAIECYNKALKIDPRYAEAWYNKGVALYNLGRYYEANICFNMAKKLGLG